MNPAALIPTMDTLPVPWGWFEVLKLLTFVCHLLLMNAVLGGAIMALATRNVPDSPKGQLGLRLPTTLALTVNMGVPPLLFLQVLYGQFLYSAAVLSAVYWMVLVGLTMLAYAMLYVHAPGCMTENRNMASLALPVAVLSLLAVSFIMVNIMSLLQRPEAWSAYFQNPHGTILNVGDPTFLPRWLHFLIASVAVGGLAVALLEHLQGKAGNRRRLELGCVWFSRASLVQILVGLWWLMALPAEIMRLFMGGSALHTSVFLLGLGAAGTAIYCGFKSQIVATSVSLAGTVLLMVGMRELLRTASLAPYFHPSTMPMIGQYSSMVLFLVSFGLGLVAIAYMLHLHRKSGGGI